MRLGILMSPDRRPGLWAEVVPHKVTAGLAVALTKGFPRAASVSMSYPAKDHDWMLHFLDAVMKNEVKADVYLHGEDVDVMWTIVRPRFKLLTELRLDTFANAIPGSPAIEFLRITSTAGIDPKVRADFEKHLIATGIFVVRVAEPDSDPRAVGVDPGLLCPGGRVFDREMNPLEI